MGLGRRSDFQHSSFSRKCLREADAHLLLENAPLHCIGREIWFYWRHVAH